MSRNWDSRRDSACGMGGASWRDRPTSQSPPAGGFRGASSSPDSSCNAKQAMTALEPGMFGFFKNNKGMAPLALANASSSFPRAVEEEEMDHPVLIRAVKDGIVEYNVVTTLGKRSLASKYNGQDKVMRVHVLIQMDANRGTACKGSDWNPQSCEPLQLAGGGCPPLKCTSYVRLDSCRVANLAEISWLPSQGQRGNITRLSDESVERLLSIPLSESPFGARRGAHAPRLSQSPIHSGNWRRPQGRVDEDGDVLKRPSTVLAPVFVPQKPLPWSRGSWRAECKC